MCIRDRSYSESTLIKKGAGTMTVTGPTGGFNALVDIQSGTIRYVNAPGSSMIPPGNINIAQGAQVVFDNAEIFPSGERFTGQGTIRKTGAARFHYSGDSSGFSGSTIIDGGELYLANGWLGGTVTINAGGRLQGTGRVGTTDILAGGMLVLSLIHI